MCKPESSRNILWQSLCGACHVSVTSCQTLLLMLVYGYDTSYFTPFQRFFVGSEICHILMIQV